jgi:hypothetical protein
MLFVPPSMSAVEAQDSGIPAWIKNNAGWWADGQIDDSSFLQGIQYLIKEGIMVIPPTETSGSSESQGVPAWVKNNAGWWADGQIDDNSFISGIQYLIKSGIIVVEQEQAQPTQPTVTDNEIQKLADEYLDCFTGERVTSGCVAWDEDKHAIGIEELTDISEYWVGNSEIGGINSCDTDCNLSHNWDYDVDASYFRIAYPIFRNITRSLYSYSMLVLIPSNTTGSIFINPHKTIPIFISQLLNFFISCSWLCWLCLFYNNNS